MSLALDSWTSSLLSSLGGVLDLALLRGMSLAYHEALVPPLGDYARLREVALQCARDAESPAGRTFLSSALGETRTSIAMATRAVAGGAIVTRRFASRYEPYRAYEDVPDCDVNDAIWVEHWMHAGERPRATLLALHGFTMGNPRIDAHVLMAERWFRMGLDVALMTLPFHGARASAECRYSGERFASWHAGRLNEAVRQSVHDAAIVARWLAETRETPVGVLGVSLGGYVTALLASSLADLAFAIPVVPAVCLADLPSRLFPLSRSGRAGGEPPLTVAELREAYRVHSPLSLRLALPRQRVFVVAALADGITRTWHARRLWEHWERPEALWFSGGHVSPFHRSRVAGAIESHLRTLDLAGAPPRADASQPAAAPHAAGARVVPLRVATR